MNSSTIFFSLHFHIKTLIFLGQQHKDHNTGNQNVKVAKSLTFVGPKGAGIWRTVFYKQNQAKRSK